MYQTKYDGIAAVNFIKNYPATKDLKISLAGHSAGAYAAILVSEACDVKNVLAMSSFDSPREAAWSLMDEKIGGFRYLLFPFLDLTMTIGGKDNYVKASEVIDRNPDKTYFLMHCSYDTFVPYETASLIRKYNTPTFDYRSYEMFHHDGIPEFIPEYYEIQHKDNVYSQLITWSTHSDTWLSYDSQAYTMQYFWWPIGYDVENNNPEKLKMMDYIAKYGHGRVDKDKTTEMNTYALSKVVELFK